MKMKFLMAFLILSLIAIDKPKAQFSLSFNIGTQPIWGPVGYDHVENYYLPDIEAYYNVPQKRYTYMQYGRWTTSYSLPPRYRNYNLYTGYKVVVNEPRPYLHDNDYKAKYASFKGRHDQQPIRDSREQKYFENKNHPQHNQWKENGHDNRGRNGKDENGKKGHGDGKD